MNETAREAILSCIRGVIPQDRAPAATAIMTGSRAASQSNRRRVILTATRDLFSERGSRNVTVRNVASRSGVSPPTIYSLIGGRDVVLESALLQSLYGCIEVAPRVAKFNHTNPILSLADTFWVASQMQPTYGKNQIDLNTKCLEGRRISRFFTTSIVEAITLWLGEICDPARIRGGMNLRSIATSIEANFRIAALDWADGCDSLTTYRRRMALGAATPLLAFVDNAEGDRIMDWLTHINAPSDAWSDAMGRDLFAGVKMDS